MAELLIELLSEEIPARMQDRAAADLKRLVCAALDEAGLAYDGSDAYATPRRLALVVDGLPEKQPDISTERKGPRVGAPEQAIQGFLKSASLDSLDQCEVRDVKGTEFYFIVQEKKGGSVGGILVDALRLLVWSFPWPKSMRWGDGRASYVRPLHSIVLLFNGETVNLMRDGISTEGSIIIPVGNKTVGHRFMAPDEITVSDFADYRDKLRTAYVMLDSAERRSVIETDAAMAAEMEGLTLKPDAGLVAEVAGLVEWPVVLIGAIDPEYMDLPGEVLTTSMRHHLKHFALLDNAGNPAPRFAVVANIHAVDGGRQIVAGNERVLRARLADAKFFWDQDAKRSLASRIPDLDALVFHAKLGSVGEKVARIEALAEEIAKLIPAADLELASRAAELCKADLVTQMVAEFPELQGVMGRYYALEEKKPKAVANAIAEHYAPLGPNDPCPKAPVSVAVALADKIDTLVGFWGIDEKPTGSKDPFALRRAALGVIRLIDENKIKNLSLLHLFEIGLDLYKNHLFETNVAYDLYEFIGDRLKVHLKNRGVRHDVIEAVLALEEYDLMRLIKRVEALQDFITSEDGEHLLIAYRRATNILDIEENKNPDEFVQYNGGKNLNYDRQEKAEISLIASLTEVRKRAGKALSDEKFVIAMTALARLRKPVDYFFDEVTVNVDDEVLRDNRLNLLADIRAEMKRFADFSKIEG